MNWLLIDRDNLKILKRCGMNEGIAWANAICPNHVIIVGRFDEYLFHNFTVRELRQLVRNMGWTTAATDDGLIQELQKFSAELPIDKTSLYAIERLTPTNAPDEPKNRPIIADTASNSDLKPKAGTATGRVWEVAQQVYAEGSFGKDFKALRSAIIEACRKEGINESTAATQYSKWKAATLS